MNANGTITDNDTQTVSTVTLSSATTLTEGGSAVTYQVTLSWRQHHRRSSTTYAFTMEVGLQQSMARPPSPVASPTTRRTGTITVPAGVTNFQVTVPTAQDTLYENAETLECDGGQQDRWQCHGELG